MGADAGAAFGMQGGVQQQPGLRADDLDDEAGVPVHEAGAMRLSGRVGIEVVCRLVHHDEFTHRPGAVPLCDVRESYEGDQGSSSAAAVSRSP